MANKHLPCPTLLRQLLRYEPDTGKLFWKEKPEHICASPASCKTWNKRFSGKEAFATVSSHGYMTGMILGVSEKAHRVMWALVHGSWPECDIDHINGVRHDNKIGNLRSVTRTLNVRNAKMYSNNTSGHTGVTWSKAHAKWRSHIRLDGKRKHLGMFGNIDDAIAARRRAEIGHKFTERHGSSA